MLAQPPLLQAAPIHLPNDAHPNFGAEEKRMLDRFRSYGFLILSLGLLLFAASGRAQGNSGSIEGVVKDQSGASVPGAKAEISYPVSGYHRETTTDTDG